MAAPHDQGQEGQESRPTFYGCKEAYGSYQHLVIITTKGVIRATAAAAGSFEIDVVDNITDKTLERYKIIPDMETRSIWEQWLECGFGPDFEVFEIYSPEELQRVDAEDDQAGVRMAHKLRPIFREAGLGSIPHMWLLNEEDSTKYEF